MHKQSRFFGLAAASAMFLSAMPALAATPQQILDKNLADFNPANPSKISAEINIKVNEKRWVKTPSTGPEAANITFRYDQRSLGKQGTQQDGEGALTIAKADITSQGQTTKLDQPISLEWRMVNPTLYGRIGQMPDSILNLAKSMGVNLTSYVGQWFKLDMPADSQTALSQISGQSMKAEESLNVLQDMAEKKMVRISYIEKKYKNPANEQMARVRLAPNYSALYKAHLSDLSAAYKIKDRTERLAKIKALNAEYTDTYKELMKLKMVANINLDKGRTERVEFGLTQTDPKKECDYNKKDVLVCKTVGNTTVSLLGGINILTPDTTPIVAPTDAKTLDSLRNILTPTTTAETATSTQ